MITIKIFIHEDINSLENLFSNNYEITKPQQADVKLIPFRHYEKYKTDDNIIFLMNTDSDMQCLNSISDLIIIETTTKKIQSTSYPKVIFELKNSSNLSSHTENSVKFRTNHTIFLYIINNLHIELFPNKTLPLFETVFSEISPKFTKNLGYLTYELDQINEIIEYKEFLELIIDDQGIDEEDTNLIDAYLPSFIKKGTKVDHEQFKTLIDFFVANEILIREKSSDQLKLLKIGPKFNMSINNIK